MAEAIFRHGNPVMTDYDNGSTAISAGDIIAGPDGGLETLIAHKDIAANERGALAAGGGVYDVPVSAAEDAYTFLYWDDTNNVAVNTGGSRLGYLVEASAGSNAVAKVLHAPQGEVTA